MGALGSGAGAGVLERFLVLEKVLIDSRSRSGETHREMASCWTSYLICVVTTMLLLSV